MDLLSKTLRYLTTKLIKKHMKKINKIIKNIFYKFGIGLYRIKKNEEISKAILSKEFALDFNSYKAVNSWYSLDKHVDDYLSEGRISFYTELINLANTEGVTFENKNILDIGCGPGALLNELNKRYKNTKLTGIDFSEHAIMYARKKMPNITFEVKDVLKDHLKDKYDIIFCTEVLEHLENPEQTLKKILTLLSTNGVLILSVPNGRVDTFMGHIHFWSPESWLIFLKKYCDDFVIKTYQVNKNIDNMAIITKK